MSKQNENAGSGEARPSMPTSILVAMVAGTAVAMLCWSVVLVYAGWQLMMLIAAAV